MPCVPPAQRAQLLTLPEDLASLLAVWLLGGCWLLGGWGPLCLVSGMEKPSLQGAWQSAVSRQLPHAAGRRR